MFAGGELGGGGTGALAARVRAQPAAARLASTSSKNERQGRRHGETFLPWPVSRSKIWAGGTGTWAGGTGEIIPLSV
jgi:hypothetical protein